MDLGYRNRNHPAHQYQQEIVKTDLVHQTIQAIHQLLRHYPHAFDLHFLTPIDPACAIPVEDAIRQLHKDTIALYRSRNVAFDSHWHWNIAWRQALSYESIAELADGDTTRIIQSCHPKCQKSVEAIYKYDLAPYMRWYPWRWFSDLVLIGSGGFSAVYAAHVALLYDASQDGQAIGQHKRPVAIKVVDEKILNEIIVQSRAFLALLFHGITVCESTGDILMITTLAEEGNLEHRIGKPVEYGLDMMNVTDIVTRLAFNLASLHDEIGMCHRNIHPANVLCSDDDYFLIDFRFSTASNEASDVIKSFMGHYGRAPYIAPEVRSAIYTEKSDIYSLGVIMWQLISGVVFPSPEVFLDAEDVYRIEWIPGVPRWYQELTMACLEPCPEHRPLAEEVGLIARKFAVSPQSEQMRVHQKDWIAYATRRREACQAHQQRWSTKGRTTTTTTTPSSTTPTTANGHGGGGGGGDLIPTRNKEEDDMMMMMTASRVYEFRNLPSLDELVNLPFHHRPFDAADLSGEY